MKLIIKNILILAIFFIVWIITEKNPESGIQNHAHSKANKPIPTDLYYTKHALCRMDCRKISKSEIKETITTGKVNKVKSNLNAKPCPVKAFEKQYNRGDKIRVVLAECFERSKIVTVIRLGKEFACNC